MRSVYLFLTFSFLLFTNTLGTAGELSTKAESCSCKLQPEPFEAPIRFGFGPYRGQCVSSCKFRGAVSLSKAQARRYGADKDHVVVANFLHHGRYWVARVPTAEVAEVDFEFEKFLSLISHVALRFHFKKRVELFNQDLPPHAKPDATTTDLILSAEAVPPKDHPFVFSESSMGQYLLAYRILSIDETVDWMVVSKKHQVKQFSLDLPPEKRTRLIEAALHESENKSFQTAYQLLTNNCATSLMRFIVSTIGYQPTLYDRMGFVAWQEAIPLDAPVGTLFALSAMHLLPKQRPNLEEEFRAFATSRANASPLYR